LPKSSRGRKARPLDDVLYKALSEYLTKTQVQDGRPAFAGPSNVYETRGKALGDGRRYAKALTSELNKIVRVNSLEVSETEHKWRVYVPLTENKTVKK